MAKYRIEHRYPCYANGGCIPYDGYFVRALIEELDRHDNNAYCELGITDKFEFNIQK